MSETPIAYSIRVIDPRNCRNFDNLGDQFDLEYPTEAHVLSEIYRQLANCGLLICRHCRSDLNPNPNYRFTRCANCKKTVYPLAETFFHRSKKLRYLFGILWMMSHGVHLTASSVARVTGAAQSTISELLKKPRLVLVQQMSDQADCVLSAVFMNAFGKRSRLTPANMHPKAEESELSLSDSSAPINPPAINDTKIPLDELQANEKRMLTHLSDDPIHIEELCNRLGQSISQVLATLTMLDLSGYAVSIHGNYCSRKKEIPRPQEHALATGTQRSVDELLASAKERYRRISRRYLQLYLSAQWCVIDPARWDTDTLVQTCLRFGRISYRALKEYVTPRAVLVIPLQSGSS